MRGLVKNKKKGTPVCIHSFREDTTFRTRTISAVGVPMYYVVCKVCGKQTIICFTEREAHERAKRGWMK